MSPLETHARQLRAKLRSRGEGRLGQVVHVPKPAHGEAPKERYLVVPGIGVEIGVEARGDRDAERPGRPDRRHPQRPLGGDVDQIGAVRFPDPPQLPRGGHPHPQEGIAGDRQAGHRYLPVIPVRLVGRQVPAPGAVNCNRMASPPELACDDSESHRHPVDFRGKSFGDYREFHGMRGLRIPICTAAVPILCRNGYDFGKSVPGSASCALCGGNSGSWPAVGGRSGGWSDGWSAGGALEATGAVFDRVPFAS